jgi:hypothetical protein
MNKWLMLVVLVLLVLTAAMGLRSYTTPFDGVVITSPSTLTMAPTTAPPPAIPWK